MQINKKNLALIVVLLVVLAAGFLVYKYNNKPLPQPQPQTQTQEPAQTQEQNQPQPVQIDTPQIEVETQGGSPGGLLVCLDKCEDGICQPADIKCQGMNCVCPETPQTCPQDCKQ